MRGSANATGGEGGAVSPVFVLCAVDGSVPACPPTALCVWACLRFVRPGLPPPPPLAPACRCGAVLRCGVARKRYCETQIRTGALPDGTQCQCEGWECVDVSVDDNDGGGGGGGDSKDGDDDGKGVDGTKEYSTLRLRLRGRR